MPNENETKINPNPTEEKVIHTYVDDMAQVIENNREGLIKNIIHQDEERENEKISQSPEAVKNRIMIGVSAFLVLSSIAIIAVLIYKQKPNIVELQQQFTPLVFTDKSVFLEISGLNKEKIIQTILNTKKEAVLRPGQVEGIYLTENKNIVGLKRFTELTKNTFVLPTSPAGNVGLVSDNFLMGVTNTGTSNEFFILLKTRSMTDIWGSLRAWENKMFEDLYRIFELDLSSDTKYLLTKDFSDSIINNKNARTLYQNNGGVAIMYIFANNTSIVITKDKLTAREIIERLSSSKIGK